LYNKKEIKNKLNYYGKNKIPFFFIVDYKLNNYEIIPLDKLPKDIKYNIIKDDILDTKINKISMTKYPLSFFEYKIKFDKIQSEIQNGNAYLLNLTSKTPIKFDATLNDIYNKSNAKFKLFYKNQFICFSPERFIKIENNTISTYPMKGTINADIKNAEKIILNNKKELAEHTMVVDLLRNDLSLVSKKVRVEKFRYINKIIAGKKDLLQVSSKIKGDLNSNWSNNLGDIVMPLLPAGSITGTPKKSTISILEKIEGYQRGYYTGIFGIFDGISFDSGVMIRFIEKIDNKFYYKSGGGITCDSDPKSEYKELCDKIYL